MEQDIFLKNNTKFANGYNRVVHGERGDYVEFEKNHIEQELISKFGNDLESSENEFYYYWLYPVSDKKVKVYYQKKLVKYADYRIGKYYVSPIYLLNFHDKEQLFPYF